MILLKTDHESTHRAWFIDLKAEFILWVEGIEQLFSGLYVAIQQENSPEDASYLRCIWIKIYDSVARVRTTVRSDCR